MWLFRARLTLSSQVRVHYGNSHDVKETSLMRMQMRVLLRTWLPTSVKKQIIEARVTFVEVLGKYLDGSTFPLRPLM